MKLLKRILLTVFTIIVVTSLLLIVSGNAHLFKGISHTYLVGKTGPTIDDYTKFENRTVEASNHQPWNFADNYNKTENKKLLSEIESFDPAAFLIVKSDKIIY